MTTILTTEGAEIIPNTSFTKGEDELLIALLHQVRKDKCHWPTEGSTRVAHGIVSYWAPELVIRRDGPEGAEFLLVRYEGGIEEFRNFWHIPGGYNKPSDQDEPGNEVPPGGWGMKSIQPTVSRIAKRELGVDVKVVNLLDIFWWQRCGKTWEKDKGQHPYGTPLSIYVACIEVEEIQETDKVRFFSAKKLPTPIVPAHKHFIEASLDD